MNSDRENRYVIEIVKAVVDLEHYFGGGNPKIFEIVELFFSQVKMKKNHILQLLSAYSWVSPISSHSFSADHEITALKNLAFH